MVTKRNVFTFDIKKLQEVFGLLGVSSGDVARMLNRTERTLFNWKTGKSSLTIRDFLIITNTLDLDPKKFFSQHRHNIDPTSVLVKPEMVEK